MQFLKNAYNIYLLPLALVIFFISLHYYKFYEGDFKRIFSFVSPHLSENQYEEIQKEHPYYPVYQLSKDVNPSQMKYVHSEFAGEDKIPLQELTLMINYFFFPHVIQPLSPSEFAKLALDPRDIIISDIELSSPNLESLSSPNPRLKRINRYPEDRYYIYRVI